MDCEKSVSRDVYHMEGALPNSITTKKTNSLEDHVSKSKALLRQQVGRNGDNLYELLVRLISNLIDNPPAGVVDHFEEYCRLVKIDFLSPIPDFLRAKAPLAPTDGRKEKQALLAKQTLQTLTQIENENIRHRPEFSQFIRRGLNMMGLDLPRGYDYFISAHIDRTLHHNRSTKSCQFWGVVRSLCCDYYILELEHREKSVDYCAYRGVIGKHPEIITDIIDGLLEETLRRTKTPSVLSAMSFEDLENVTQSVIGDIVHKLEIVDREIEEEHCRADMNALITEMIEHLSCISSRGSSQADSSTTLTDSGASSVLCDQDTASQLRIRLERIQLESRLNSRTYLVSQNPRTKPWEELPSVTLEHLEATEELRVLLVGDLEAPVTSVVKSFDGLEKNLLRALIAKISSHRDGHINGSETNISLVRCLSGIYGSGTGCDAELFHERMERWWERKEQGVHYWLSETWPGLCTINDGDQFRCFYVGWALEKQFSWYNPIVGVPKMTDAYDAVPVQTSEISSRTEESKSDDNVSASVSSQLNDEQEL